MLIRIRRITPVHTITRGSVGWTNISTDENTDRPTNTVESTLDTCDDHKVMRFAPTDGCGREFYNMGVGWNGMEWNGCRFFSQTFFPDTKLQL